MKIHKILSTFTFFALLMSMTPGMVSAQVSTNIQAQLDLLVKLQEQVRQLQLQSRAIQSQQQQIVSELVTTLKQGSKGDQVSALQALLAADPDIYPEGLITGFFGKATERAVKKFQSKNGLDSLGIVGPMTRGKLNSMLKNTPLSFETSGQASTTLNTTSTTNIARPCAILPPGHLIAPGWLRKQGGVVPIVPPCQKLPPGIAKKITPGTPTSTPPAPTSTPDLAAPIISGISTASASGTATISWSTNESSTSKIYYSTSTPVILGSTSTLIATGANSVISHAVTLIGLTASSTFYFVVESADASLNVATSTTQSFTTTF